ncbi:hypothetical protein SAY87_024726 [Trapa incisa]|uniref:Uncharacterized protein n=1 Tax=Trapa incisa TaxID=236973 RepID=A0AAN7GKC0_9MYRT|nr:hypothetical protein SAY87_024726 [Trapa incisa]
MRQSELGTVIWADSSYYLAISWVVVGSLSYRFYRKKVMKPSMMKGSHRLTRGQRERGGKGREFRSRVSFGTCIIPRVRSGSKCNFSRRRAELGPRVCSGSL